MTANFSIQIETAQSFNVSLTPYKLHNPCRFDVGYLSHSNFTWLFPSGAVAVNETNDPKGPTTWTFGHPAPMGSQATNVTTTSGGQRLDIDGGRLAGMAVLLALGAWMI